jgi:DNA-binding winged helix-turn-helix (wHTH) protein
VAFGPYLLDSRARSLSRAGEPVGLSQYEYEVLHLLVRRPNVVHSKDVLIRAGWQDVAVGDNSLEKLVSKLRRHLDADDLNRYIKTVPRQGYQFVAPVTAVERQEAATNLELLLAPHRAFTEGRVALESLQCTRIATARATFQKLLQEHPGDASYQIGMANACAMQFEATRTDPAPDAEALRLAECHARHDCHLDPDLAEAWATLGFVLERTGRRQDALAALERAVVPEPDNWRQQVRLALGSWGEARLRAARRALTQCPQLPLAHWLAATVFVARNALEQAERDIDRALAVAAVESPDAAPYSMVARHWLKGLLRMPASAVDEAMASFDQELALEARGHLYAREAAANTC